MEVDYNEDKNIIKIIVGKGDMERYHSDVAVDILNVLRLANCTILGINVMHCHVVDKNNDVAWLANFDCIEFKNHHKDHMACMGTMLEVQTDVGALDVFLQNERWIASTADNYTTMGADLEDFSKFLAGFFERMDGPVYPSTCQVSLM